MANKITEAARTLAAKLRGNEPQRTTSGPPSTVGAPKPGEPGGVKSATAPTRSKKT